VCLVSLAAGAASLPVVAQPRALPQPYHATYEVQYKGRRVGQAEFRLAYDDATQRYSFSSTITATGLLRLVRPRPVIETGEFVLSDDEVRPLHFAFEDGTRGGLDNFTLTFDWDQNALRAEQGGHVTELPLESGTLDRGTLQVSIMRDVRSGLLQPRYRLADEDSVREYDYQLGDTEPLVTGAGDFATRRLIQSRSGSNRLTIMWLAPALGYLPVRIEQQRAGETRTTLLLEQVTGLAPDAPQDATH
jgi:hypothetical protein